MKVPTLLVTGTVGVGKSAVASEISDTLAEREIPHAAIDLDALVWQWPPSSAWNNDLMFENLAALWPIYHEHGSTHLVLARVLEDVAELDRYRAAIPGAEITICRLVAPQGLRITRLRARMPEGPALMWHVARTIELEAILVQAAPEHFTVENGHRNIREVAVEVLERAGWDSGRQLED